MITFRRMKRLIISPSTQVPFLMAFVRWLSLVFKPEIAGMLVKFDPFLSHLDHINRTRGPKDMVRQMKIYRSCVLAYLAGQPIEGQGVRLTSDGLPTVLGPLIGEQRRTDSPTLQPFQTTVLFSTRALMLGKEPDVSTIESLSTATVQVGSDKRFSQSRVRSFWAALGYKGGTIPRRLNWTRFHQSTKAGPNGHAQYTWIRDLVSMPSQLKTDLVILGGRKFERALNVLESNLEIIPGSKEPGIIRRIAYFPDKETKVRVVGILDYFSQSVLRSLHSYLYRVLAKIPQDCTFNQGSWKDKASGWEVYHSVDLTAATDRFPISVIARVLLGRQPASYVEAWVRVMVSHPFDFNGRLITYSVGNPMGAYSSWASFALAHHFLFYTICQEIGIPWNTAKYCVLGDDVVIGDDRLAAAYKDLIRELGVGMSKDKTYTSPHFAEFAKRILYKGVEVTPFPVSALMEASRRDFSLAQLFMESRSKGWVSPLGIRGQVESFYRTFLTFRSAQAARHALRAWHAELMMDIMRGLRPASAQLNAMLGGRSQLPNLNDFVSESILRNAVVEAFSMSNPASGDNSKRGRPQGLYAEELVIYFTGQIETTPSAMDVLSVHPHLQVYGSVEEMYMKVVRDAFRIDQTGEDWPFLMKCVALPLDDQFFVERTSRVIMRAASRQADLLQQRLEVLAEYPQMLD